MSPVSPNRVQIKIAGPFQVIGSDKRNCTPSSKKACAILAMLALANGFTRSRQWLQDTLWSDREQTQGAASLRQSLSHLRRMLGDDRDLIRANLSMVSLDRSRFELHFELENQAFSGLVPGIDFEFLEGVDVRDPEFKNWLRDQRSFLQKSVASADLGHVATTQSNGAGHAQHLHNPVAARPRPTIVLAPSTLPYRENYSNGLFACSVQDAVAKSLSEMVGFEVVDRRPDSMIVAHGQAETSAIQEFHLRTDISGDQSAPILRMALTSIPEGKIIWTNSIPTNNSLQDERLLLEVNQIAGAAMSALLRTTEPDQPELDASSLCYQGIQEVFTLQRDNFLRADKFFKQAFEREPKGIYLAWRSYLRTFMIAERAYDCRQTIEEECVALMRQALELDPYNSYVASFSAQSHIIAKRSYVAASELAERSIQLNQANPVGWAQLGVAQAHLGQAKEGFRHTLRARQICGAARFRFHIDGLSCIVGTMAGEFEQATKIGEVSHAFAPNFAPAMRYLTALYYRQGSEESAFDMIQKLRKFEPDFDCDKLRDSSYPTAGLQRSGLIDYLPGRTI